MKADLDQLESFYLGEGWYSDGRSEQRDYYVAFAMHYYGLIYSTLAQEQDAERCQRFRRRAARFAQDFIMWFRSRRLRFALRPQPHLTGFPKAPSGAPWPLQTSKHFLGE